MQSNIISLGTQTMDQTEELLNELRIWTKQRKGNQKVLRETLGVSKQLVSAWVRGRAVPSLELGFRLKAFLQSHKASKTKQPVGDQA